jgi:hypothetical protein
MIDRERLDAFLDLAHGRTQVRIVAEIAVAFPQGRHLGNTPVRDAGRTRQGGGKVAAGAAGVVLEEPFLEVMDALEVVPPAGAPVVAGELDLAEEVLGSVGVLPDPDHAGEAETLLEETPAIDGSEIDRWRLDVVVDLEGEIDVGGALEFLRETDDALADGQLRPLSVSRFFHHRVERFAPLEKGVHGETTVRGGRVFRPGGPEHGRKEGEASEKEAGPSRGMFHISKLTDPRSLAKRSSDPVDDRIGS